MTQLSAAGPAQHSELVPCTHQLNRTLVKKPVSLSVTFVLSFEKGHVQNLTPPLILVNFDILYGGSDIKNQLYL